MRNVIPFEQVRKQELEFSCSKCGADRGCDCNAPAIKKAAAAIAANPQKSNRAIAAETGVGLGTVNRARKAGEPHGSPEVAEVRIGRDGKSYKKKKPTAPTTAPTAPTAGPEFGRRTKHDERKFCEERAERADKVVAVLVERIGLDGLALIHAALSYEGPVHFKGAVERKFEGIKAVEDPVNFWSDFFEWYAHRDEPLPDEDDAEGNGVDPDASAKARKAAMAADEVA
jgi:hypothetical protein